jgi:hypothetical protein
LQDLQSLLQLSRQADELAQQILKEAYAVVRPAAASTTHAADTAACRVFSNTTKTQSSQLLPSV